MIAFQNSHNCYKRTMTGRFFSRAVTSVQLVSVRLRTMLGSPRKSLLIPRRIHSTANYSNIPGHLPRSPALVKTGGLEMSVATLNDFHQVVNLCSNVFNGTDYIHALYLHLVNEPHAEGILFRADDELVAFFRLSLVDQGETVFAMSLRVKDSLQGQGLARQVNHSMFQRIYDHSLYQRVRRLLLVTQVSMETFGMRVLLTKHRTGRAFKASSLSQFTLKVPQDNVTALRTDEITDLFQSHLDDWAHLFPQNQFLIAMRPYTIIPDNVPVILSSGLNTQFYGTRGADGRYTLLSAGSYHFCQVGVHYHVDIFGSVGVTESQAVREHLITHLQRLQTMGSILPGTVVFDVFAEDTAEEEMKGVTGELEENFSFVWDDDVMMLWEKIMRE